MSIFSLLILPLNLLKVNAKQSSLRNAAFEAARLVVEQQYKIEDGNGCKASPEEIQVIVRKELSSEPLQWTVGTTYTNREASMITFSTSHDLLRNTPVLHWYLSAPVYPSNYFENLLYQEWPVCWAISTICLYIRPYPIATHCFCSYLGMSLHFPHAKAC
jgi:hypothetical protein